MCLYRWWGSRWIEKSEDAGEGARVLGCIPPLELLKSRWIGSTSVSSLGTMLNKD
jgi:hypothetical protein